MNERNIEKTLKDLQAPAPDPMARLRAKRAALAEFERANATVQESNNVIRLSRESTSGSPSMKRVANRAWYSIAAGVGVVAIGLTWVLPNLGRYERELSGPDVSAVPPADESPLSSEPAPQSAAGAEPQPVPPAATVEADSGEVAAATRDAELRKQLEDAASSRAVAAAAKAQDERQAAPLAAGSPEPEPSEVVVSGLRARLESAQEAKRELSNVVEQIEAQDIGKFPDQNIAESLQRTSPATAGSAKSRPVSPPAPPPRAGSRARSPAPARRRGRAPRRRGGSALPSRGRGRRRG